MLSLDGGQTIVDCMHIIVPSCCCLHIRSDFKINQLTITSLLLPLLYPHCKLVNHQPLAHDSLVDSSRSVHYSSEYNCTMPPPRAASAFLVQQTTGASERGKRGANHMPSFLLPVLLNSIYLVAEELLVWCNCFSGMQLHSFVS